MAKTTSTSGIKLIKAYEGCELKAYNCAAGVWTIGYGHTGKVDGKAICSGMTITSSKATKLLEEDLENFESAVNKYVTVDLTQNQFDALVSFAYNCGGAALKSSTLLKKLNAEDYIEAAEEFAKWNKASGKVLSGLVKRRAAEKELFLKGYCDKPTVQVTSKTATKAETRWIQYKLGGLTIDGAWGAKTATAIKAKRKTLGWEETSGYTCTVNLIKALTK